MCANHLEIRRKYNKRKRERARNATAKARHRACTNCAIEKPELEFRGTNKTCIVCIDSRQSSKKKKMRLAAADGVRACSTCTRREGEGYGEGPGKVEFKLPSSKMCVRCQDATKASNDANRCTHGRQSSQCHDCLTLDEIIASKYFCDACCTTRLGTDRREGGSHGTGLCGGCDDTKPKPERIEHEVRERLKAAGIYEASATDNVVLGGTRGATGVGCQQEGRRRPDFSWVGTDRIIMLECDEHSHTDRTTICELAKVDSQTGSIQANHGIPSLHIRWSPHGGDFEQLTRVLTDTLKRVIECPVSDLGLDAIRSNVAYLCYQTAGQEHIDAARECPNMNVISL